jgi:hypothetical protein
MSDTKHYLGAIRLRLERLYEVYPNDPILREQISDEVDWIDTQLNVADKSKMARRVAKVQRKLLKTK